MTMEKSKFATCHPDRPKYCKGLCRYCYNVANDLKRHPNRKKRRPAGSMSDCHSNRRCYSDGLCIPCYERRAKYGARALVVFNAAETCDACGSLFSALSEKDKHVDHDHTPGLSKDEAFRGILCAFCNRAAGQLKDDVETTLKLAQYLHRRSVRAQ
jgi:hypothetical protein